MYCPEVTFPAPYINERCVLTLAVGELVEPPVPISTPPVILNVLLSQSKPSSGAVAPEEITTPPVIVSVPFESIPSLVVL